MAEWIIIQRNIERLLLRCESIIGGKLNPHGKEWKLGKVNMFRKRLCYIERALCILNYTYVPEGGVLHICTYLLYLRIAFVTA